MPKETNTPYKIEENAATAPMERKSTRRDVLEMGGYVVGMVVAVHTLRKFPFINGARNRFLDFKSGSDGAVNRDNNMERNEEVTWTHTVEEGDTLYGIIATAYPDMERAQIEDIIHNQVVNETANEAQRDYDPDVLYIGDELSITGPMPGGIEPEN